MFLESCRLWVLPKVTFAMSAVATVFGVHLALWAAVPLFTSIVLGLAVFPERGIHSLVMNLSNCLSTAGPSEGWDRKQDELISLV